MRLREHEGVESRREYLMFDPRRLKVIPDYNVRDMTTPDMREKNKELKESIRANGVKVPLEIWFDGAEPIVSAGHRRLAMVLELIEEGEPIKAVPVIQEAEKTNDADRALNLVISNSGEPLKPIEVAEVVRRLVAYGWDKPNIAKRMGWKSTGSVQQHLDMLGLPAEVQQAVKAGKVSATLARQTEAQEPGLTMKLIKADEEQPGKKLKKLKPKDVAKASPKKAKAPQPQPEQPPAEPPPQPPAQPEQQGEAQQPEPTEAAPEPHCFECGYLASECQCVPPGYAQSEPAEHKPNGALVDASKPIIEILDEWGVDEKTDDGTKVPVDLPASVWKRFQAAYRLTTEAVPEAVS